MSDELDSRAVLRAVGRRRHLVMVLGLLGLFGGVAYGVVKPVMPQATTEILLPSSLTQSDSAVATPGTDASTQIAIATSDAVLAKAARAISPPLSLPEARHQVKVRAAGSSVLSIEARATRPVDAERLANAVANDYIAYVTSTDSGSSRGLVSALSAQASALTKQLDNLKAQVATVSARLEGSRSSASRKAESVQLGSLQNQEQQVNLELDTIEGEILQDRLSTQVVSGVMQVLQPATASSGASSLRLPLLGAIGLLVGAFVGFVVTLVLGTRDRRLFWRADFAGALGLPVIASLRAERRRRVDNWSQLFQNYQPSTSDQWNLHRLLRYLEVEEGEAPFELKVLAFADDRSALALGPQLAVFAAAAGISTMLTVPEDPGLQALRGACASRPSSGGPNQLVTVASAGESAVSEDVLDAAGNAQTLKVSLAAADRDHPSLSGPSPSTTLLAVSAGFASADEIARLALASADAGQRVSGFVLVNPDPADRSSGELPASLLGWRPRTQPAVRIQPNTRGVSGTRRVSSSERRR